MIPGAFPRRNVIDLTFADPLPLPPADGSGFVTFEGAEIWCAAYGSGPPVVLLHGALGNGEDWGNQVPALVEAGFDVVLIDNRGRGRSTSGDAPLSYELMAREVVAVLDALEIEHAAIVGWSDGAIVGLLLAMHAPERVERVVAYAGNMDLSGVRTEPLNTPAMDASFSRAQRDYARLSPTPQDFPAMLAVMDELMHSQPNFTAQEIARIERPVAIVHGEHDEFILPEHARYLADTIPQGRLITLAGVSHFAPWQDPDAFNAAMLGFLRRG